MIKSALSKYKKWYVFKILIISIITMAHVSMNCSPELSCSQLAIKTLEQKKQSLLLTSLLLICDLERGNL